MPFIQRIQLPCSLSVSLPLSLVMQKTVDFLMNPSSNRKEAPMQEKRGLGNLLQEDKLFGPSTGTNSDAQSKRPQFVPFTGHFLIVEDATQAHRPPICKQWTKDATKKPAELPWPYFKHTPKFRSPFGKRGPPPPKKPADGTATADAKDAAAAQEGAKEETPKPAAADGVNATARSKAPADNNTTAKTSLQEDKENMPTPKQTTSFPHAVIKPLTATSTPSPLSSQKSQSQQQHHQQQQTTQKQPDSQNFSLRASGFQPSCTNNIQSASTRSVSTSVSILQGENRRLPPGDSVNRLDKRMVENVTLNEHQKLCKLKAQKEEQARRERELKKKRDSRFCENCSVLFENLEEVRCVIRGFVQHI